MAGAHQASRHQLGHRIHDAHAQLDRALRAAGLPQHLFQLGAQMKDVARIAVDQLAGFGQLQLATLLAEQGPANGVFEQLHLPAHRLGRDVQVLAGLDHTAEPRHRPEILQMLVVHCGLPEITWLEIRIYMNNAVA